LGLSVQQATQDADSGAALPQSEVRVLGLAGGVLNASLDFSLEATLWISSLLGCGVYPAIAQLSLHHGCSALQQLFASMPHILQ
jgi:hypothetical protein